MRSKLFLKLSVLMGGLVTSMAAQAYVAEKDVEYDYINGTSLKMDVYRPSNPGTALRPALIFIHGGCYNSGSKSQINNDVKELADDGFTVFSLDYRLAQVALYPAGLTDVKQALRFIRKNSSRFQIDPNKIVTHGESAGGHLASMLGLQAAEDRKGAVDKYSNRVQLVVDWFGRADFTLTQSTGTDCAQGWIGQPRNSKTLSIYKNASLMTHVDSKSAAFFIIHGTHDPQVNPIHSTSLINTLWSKGREADLVLYEGQGHGFGSRGIPWNLSRTRILKQFGITNRRAVTKAAGAPSYFVNAGQPDLPNTSYFTPDKNFVGGTMFDYGNVKTEGTETPALYSDSRYGGKFSYKLPVVNGVYRISLYFAENSPAVTAKGMRQFDVSMSFPNGTSTVSVPVLPNFDAYAIAGPNTAIRRYVHVISKTPNLNIDFQGKIGNAFISAFSVTQTGY
ncbi:alpha/beta hydrolase fold domain-containing protein [Bdellovibrio sp. SKB1291214]|uniref:alpha/beta hydrolase fold domain-containing protein n=1 Tax=Bdellovibrio sp. SKB1291214 TaxID=1732569 RepID=UPI001595C53A|nr:alpha/beta hydrolase fold domain-containing protein [Bdellovibrio sp. SKB1291214]UYL07223.1 alpha/beta hydrolase fold domain-containing protein [Bdellovibrio sp. SKB1291214]